MKRSLFLKSFLKFLAVVMAVSVLVSIGWAIQQIWHQPDLGVMWLRQGNVYYAKAGSPIQNGDVILSIDDVPIQDSVFPYYFWQAGDIIQVDIQRNGETQSLEIPYVEAAPPLILLMRLMIVVVAFLFWLTGSIVATYLSADAKQGVLFFLACQITAASLSLGNATGQYWSAHLSILLTWWIVPVAIHFHLLFPVNKLTPRVQKLVFVGYLVPLFGFVRLLRLINIIRLPDWVVAIYPLAFYLWVAVGLGIVLLLLVRAYQTTSSAVIQRQVGLVALAGFLSLAPLITFSLVPEIVMGWPIVPSDVSILFFAGIPLGYGYAITRYKFIKLERYINRTAVIVLIVAAVCLLYFGLTAVLHTLIPSTFADPFVNLIIVALMVILYTPLQRRLRSFVENFFYGGWYDYPTAVGEITHTLEKATEIETLAEILSYSIQKTMRVHWVCLILLDWRKNKSVIRTSGQVDTSFNFENLQPEGIQTLINYLQIHAKPTTNREMRESLALEQLSSIENELLNYNPVRLWVPIHGRNQSAGVLVLGSKVDGDFFDHTDMGILNVVSRQASAAFQNAQLIAELEEKAHENEKYQKQIVYAREEERKRIARELHDEVIQPLVGFKYQVANIQTSLDLLRLNAKANQQMAQLQEEIGELIQTTRALCHDLRPPALDLGLIPSIRSIVGRFERQAGTEVSLVIEGDRAIPIREEIALCLFRFTNEALINIYKHAAAENIEVELKIEPSLVQLTIEDNGRGFAVPERLGSLMEKNHFGLVSMRERLELVDGTFQVTSAPHKGTRLEACIPL